jgi:hypothetical protein
MHIHHTESLISKIREYAPLKTIKFKPSNSQELSELRANEVIFYIFQSNQDYIQTIKEEFISSPTCYITAKPKERIESVLSNNNYIGIQRHLFPINIDLDDALLSLGDLKNGINKSEPLIRECENIIFDFDVLRKSEVKNESFAFPSGLFSEEVTQMFRYAGLSEVNRKVCIINFKPEFEDLLAQMIWYYAEAAAIRFPDHPYFSNSVNEYVVNMKSLDKTISFFKSKISGRWWVKVPDISQNKWRACSYEDYREACKDEISGELLKIFSV